MSKYKVNIWQGWSILSFWWPSTAHKISTLSENDLSLPRFGVCGNDAVTERSLPPNFMAWKVYIPVKMRGQRTSYDHPFSRYGTLPVVFIFLQKMAILAFCDGWFFGVRAENQIVVSKENILEELASEAKMQNNYLISPTTMFFVGDVNGSA